MALFDSEHVLHRPAHAWFRAHHELGWAGCPSTDNGWVRVVSNPSYTGRSATVEDTLGPLKRFRESGNHCFQAAPGHPPHGGRRWVG